MINKHDYVRFNPRPILGYWIITGLTGQGSIYYSPSSTLRNYWSHLQNLNGVRLNWKICRRKSDFKVLEVTCDVTGQVKHKMFDNFRRT